MDVERIIIFLVIYVTASSAETCHPQIEACGTKAQVEKENGVSNCTVIDDLIDCLSLIPTSQCTPNDLSLLGMLFDQENQDREKYCNNVTTTTDALRTTTGAIDCHTRAEMCATEADEDSKKGLDLCTLYTNFVNCLSSIPMTGCTHRTFILQILQQQTENQNKYCHYSLPTTTEAIDCHTRAEMCATEADEDSKKGLDLCNLYTNFVNCLSSIPMTGCTDRTFILQILHQQTENQNKYCHYSLPTTTEAIDCHTRAEMCATEADEDSKKGLDLCTLYTNFVNCLSSIPMTGCTDRTFILQILQQQTENQNKYCHFSLPTTTEAIGCNTRAQVCATKAGEDQKKGMNLCTLYTNFLNCLSKIKIQSCSDMEKAFILQLFTDQTENKEKYCNPKSETSPLPTIKARTTQFSSTKHLEVNGSRINSVTLFGLVLVIVSTLIFV